MMSGKRKNLDTGNPIGALLDRVEQTKACGNSSAPFFNLTAYADLPLSNFDCCKPPTSGCCETGIARLGASGF